jgi:tRNA nucleotidyltransferase (CCA-adding enzyme)
MAAKNARNRKPMEMRQLLQDVLKDITPKGKEAETAVAGMLRRIDAQLKRDHLQAKAMAGGSIAKGTFLAYDHDYDIFVQFDARYADQDISALLGASLKKAFPKLVTLHGSRDYFQLRDGRSFEIIPVLKIAKPSQAMNITDCSPLHVTWVKKFPKLADEIRLTRAFCKANEVYGAESYIKGFSGHVIDIITIHHGGFLKLLEAASRWKAGTREKTVIDFRKAHRGRALKELNASKLVSPLIVVDPIEPGRNAAASLGEEKFRLFIQKAREFLARPSKEFFVREAFSPARLREKAGDGRLVLLTATPGEGKEDVVGAKLLKAFEFIRDETRRYGFSLREAGWHWDKEGPATFHYLFDPAPISATYVHQGPPVAIEKHAAAFRKAHPDAVVKGGRLCATMAREHTLPENFIKSLLRHPYLKDKAKAIVLEKR